MCEFFSFVGDGFGNFHGIGWETRQKWIAAKENKSPDSHTVILTELGVPPKMQDRWDKYEYNPLTGKFTLDQPVEGHDHEAAEAWVRKLDFTRVVAPLIIKPIIHPFKLAPQEVIAQDIADLKQWASVGDSAWDSVEDSVGASVGASVWASVEAYISSFFDIKYKYDLSPAIRLWERGFVPSFDGKTWRLHAGKDAKIVYE